MRDAIAELAVSIVRFVGDDQPGIVSYEFFDADDRPHTVIDKLPIFTSEYLDANSDYPCPGLVRCRVLDAWRDSAEFVVRREQLSASYSA